MRRAGELEAFKAFWQIWDDQEARSARRYVYGKFGPLLDMAGDQKKAEVRKMCQGLTEEELRRIDRVISSSNLAGLLWEKKLLSRGVKKKLTGYIYKTGIQSWDCLEPYIDFVREQRSERPGSITYAAPFEELVRAALKRLGNEPRPRPGKF